MMKEVNAATECLGCVGLLGLGAEIGAGRACASKQMSTTAAGQSSGDAVRNDRSRKAAPREIAAEGDEDRQACYGTAKRATVVQEATVATFTIRLEDETREELEALARTSGVTLSALLRQQMDSLLGRSVRMRERDDVPHSLSMEQRQILAQQHEILTLLYVEDNDRARHHADMAEALREGYAGEYDSVFAPVQPEMSRTECGLVWDILDMFRVLGASVDRLTPEDRAMLDDDIESRLRFAGFDSNDPLEGRLLGYVAYLIRTDRWVETSERLQEVGDGGNSHHQCLPAYVRMLETHKQILEVRRNSQSFTLDAWRFSVAELRRVAEEWVHPDNRARARRLPPSQG